MTLLPHRPPAPSTYLDLLITAADVARSISRGVTELTTCAYCARIWDADYSSCPGCGAHEKKQRSTNGLASALAARKEYHCEVCK